MRSRRSATSPYRPSPHGTAVRSRNYANCWRYSMNDIEELLAHLPFPEPSRELDARIAQLTSRPMRRTSLRAGVRRFGLLVACSACAGLIGFVLGRQTAPPVAGNDLAAVAPATPIAQVSESVPEPTTVNVY